MNWTALLVFCYGFVWKALGLGAIGFVLATILVSLRDHHIKKLNVVRASLYTMFLFPIVWGVRIFMVGWALMFLVSAGHWIGMY